MITKFFLANSSFRGLSDSQIHSRKTHKNNVKTIKSFTHHNKPHSQQALSVSDLLKNENNQQSPLINQCSGDFSFFLPENDNTSVKSSSNKKKVDKEVQTSFTSNQSFEKKSIRWVISLCDCFINISKFYCMDSPQALQTFFYRGSFHLSSTEYNLFYSIFAFFFLLTFFSGYFVEKNGIRFSLFLFCLLCFIGQFFFTLGGTLENYPIMLIGRLIFGIGCSCVEVCQDLLISAWFFDKELALAVGLSFASCRFGSALTILITPNIMIYGSYSEALIIGLVLSFLGVVCSLIIIILDRNFEEEKDDFEDLESFLRDYSFIENGLTFEKLKDMGGIFWIMVLNALFAYACYFGFVNNSNDILCTLYGYTPQQAGELVTIMYFSAALTPIFGCIIDRIGKRVNILLILLVFLMIPFMNLFFLPITYSKKFIVLSLIFIGVFFSSYAAVLWSSFPLLIEWKKKCMGYAIIYATLNISVIFASVFVGVSFDINDKNDDKNTHQYNWAFLCMIICLVLSFCLVLRINFVENKKISALNSFVTNQEIRNIINEDPYLGQQILDMIEDADKDNPTTFEMKTFVK